MKGVYRYTGSQLTAHSSRIILSSHNFSSNLFVKYLSASGQGVIPHA